MSDLPEFQDREVWEPYGACLGVDPDLFFPPRGAPSQQAKAVCEGCCVKGECLEFAMRTNQKFGIWGGTSYKDRRRMRGHNLPPARQEPPQLELVNGGQT
jgi:WhiB family redox-sensing transcriptional regulator